MQITVDTNILLYACDPRAGHRHDIARLVVSRLVGRNQRLALQVCGETFHNLRRKLKWTSEDAETFSHGLLGSFVTFAATEITTRAALALASSGRLSFWDANLVAAAEAAGCTHLLSEDMADGFRHGGLEIVHPFAGSDLSPRADALLSP